MKQSEIITAINVQNTIILDREAKLSSTDYVSTKLAEGKVTKTECKKKIDQRQQWRDDINAAQAEIARLQALTPTDEPAE